MTKALPRSLSLGSRVPAANGASADAPGPSALRFGPATRRYAPLTQLRAVAADEIVQMKMSHVQPHRVRERKYAMSKKNSKITVVKNTNVINQQYSNLGSALMGALEPVIKVLDQFASETSDHGHELPSRKDSSLRILVGSIARVVHQQLHGYKTNTGSGFDGIIAGYDKALNNLSSMINRANVDPDTVEEDLLSDPNYLRTMTYVQGLESKIGAFEEMLQHITDVYTCITGEKWTPEIPKKQKLSTDQIKALLNATEEHRQRMLDKSHGAAVA